MKTYCLYVGSKKHTVKAENKEEAFKKFKAKFHTTKISFADIKVDKA